MSMYKPLADQIRPDSLDEVVSTLRLELDGQQHRVCIYFPCLFALRVRALRVDDGATVTPVQKSLNMLIYGDSITQGYDAQYPSQAYANLIADALDANAVNQAIGGEVFRPQILTDDIVYVPDLITVAYGTNDWSTREREATVNDATAFFANLRATYPKAKIFALTPIWRADNSRVTKVGAFEEAIALVGDIARSEANAILLDGRPFVPHVPEFFSDRYLHPNDMGFKCYATALFEAMKPYLARKEG